MVKRDDEPHGSGLAGEKPEPEPAMTQDEFDAKAAAVRAEMRKIKADKAGLAAALRSREAEIKAQEGDQ